MADTDLLDTTNVDQVKQAPPPAEHLDTMVLTPEKGTEPIPVEVVNDVNPTDEQPTTTDVAKEQHDKAAQEILDDFDPLAGQSVTAEERKLSESGLTDL